MGYRLVCGARRYCWPLIADAALRREATRLKDDDDFDEVFSVPGFEKLPQFNDLKGKTVFITGGGSGIGAFFTAAFAMQGANVGLVSLTRGPAEQLCAHVLQKTGRRALPIECDIRSIDALQAAIGQVEEKFGAIDILVNNAARDTRHTVADWSVKQWDDSIATNLRPSFFSVQSIVPGMRAAKSGSIINVGSNSFQLGLAGYPTYVAAKAGIIGLTKAFARELGADGIRVNALIPGWVMTERQKRLWVNDEDLQACLEQQCLKSPLSGWDMAAPALFLASSASSMITGQELIVDGGRA